MKIDENHLNEIADALQYWEKLSVLAFGEGSRERILETAKLDKADHRYVIIIMQESVLQFSETRLINHQAQGGYNGIIITTNLYLATQPMHYASNKSYIELHRLQLLAVVTVVCN